MSTTRHKVHMTIDDYTYSLIKEMMAIGEFDTMVEAIRDAILVKYSLQLQKIKGFTELELINPDTNERLRMAQRIR